MKITVFYVLALLPLSVHSGSIALQLTEQTEALQGTLCQHKNNRYKRLYLAALILFEVTMIAAPVTACSNSPIRFCFSSPLKNPENPAIFTYKSHACIRCMVLHAFSDTGSPSSASIGCPEAGHAPALKAPP